MTGPTTIGPYTILGELGRGGMGTVYRARDTRLRRDVALKVLPEDLRLTPERLARFEQEARIVAALNHPNIAAIYGIEEEAGGIQALVLELVEGTSLAARIAQGHLRISEVLDIARQIAQALEAAHEKGIVHRDLKPANVILTATGLVKVLDFGIAKMTDTSDVATAQTTVTAGLTHEGLAVGTPAYMSPEQARAQTVDRRTDIWAFGCVLYEMLAGRRAFAGTSATDTLAAVLTSEPNWSALPSRLPPAIRALLKRCLERERFKRLGDVAAVRFALEDVLDLSTFEQTAAAGGRRTSRSTRITFALLLSGVLIAGVLGVAWSRRSNPVTVTPIQLLRLTEFVGMEESPAISPDGNYVAFVSLVGGIRQIWLRSMNGIAAARQVTFDGVDKRFPRWVDSQNLIYFTPPSIAGEEGKIWEIPAILEGPPRPRITAAAGGDVSPDGSKLAAFRLNEGRVQLQVVDRESGRTVSAHPIPIGRTLGTIRWAPDGTWLAYQRSETAFSDRLFVVAAVNGDGDAKEVARAASIQGFDWLPDGAGLIYASSEGSTVLYPPIFTLRTVARDGTANRQLTLGDDSYTQPDVDPLSGNLVAARIRMQSNIFRIHAEGEAVSNTEKRFPITRQTGLAQTASMSPDGTRVAFLSDSGGHGNVWIANTDGSGARQLTTERDPSVAIGVPIWSTVGDQIAFIVTRNATKTDIDLIAADGSGRRTVVSSGIGAVWSADARWLYYSSRIGKMCIERIPMPSGGTPEPVRCDGSLAAAISRDNSTLYFFRYLQQAYGEIGTEIFKATPPEGKEEKLASVVGARVPVNVGMLTGVLSNDNKRFALPLMDGQTSNVWVMSTDDGSMRKLTDFGDRAVMIARRVAWSPDDRFLYAAVGDMDADVLLIRGLWPGVSSR